MINCSGITTSWCCFDPFTVKAIYFGWQETCKRHGAKAWPGIRKSHVFRQKLSRRRSLFCHRAILGCTSELVSLLKCLSKHHLQRCTAWRLIFDPKVGKEVAALTQSSPGRTFLFTHLCLARDTDKWDSGDSRKKYSESSRRFTKDNPSISGWPVLPFLNSAHTTALASLLLSPVSEWFVWGSQSGNPSLRQARR